MFLLILTRLLSFLSFVFLRKIKIKIVTGSDSSHYHSMLQLINSIKIFNANNISIVAYDLGLLDSEQNYFTQLHPNIELKKFEFSEYPDFFNIKINAGEYAWKPAIIKKEYDLIGSNEYILWLDAGCFVKRELNLLKFTLFFYHIFSPPSIGIINEMTHSTTIQKMNMEAYKSLPMLSGGIIGLRRTSKNDSLVNDWSFFSEQHEIISPIGSNRSNHRQDQSIFSLLFYKYYMVGKLYQIINKQWEILAHKDIG